MTTNQNPNRYEQAFSTRELRRGMPVVVRHENGVEDGTVIGWTHSQSYGDTTLVDVKWNDGTISSVSISWIIG
jgi:hypothetical protein